MNRLSEQFLQLVEDKGNKAASLGYWLDNHYPAILAALIAHETGASAAELEDARDTIDSLNTEIDSLLWLCWRRGDDKAREMIALN